MTNVTLLYKELESWIQTETLASDRLRALVDAQIESVRSRNPRGLEEATRAVSKALLARAASDTVRMNLFQRIAKAHGVPWTTLTLGAIVERAGADGDVLAALRTELRRATSDLMRSVRRMSVLARAHREIVREALVTIAGADSLSRGGALVNAEA